MHDFDEDKQKKEIEDIQHEEEEELVQFLASTKYNLPYADLSKIGIDNEALRTIPERDARELVIAPFKLVGKNIYIALRSPFPETIEHLKQEMTNKALVPVFYMTSIKSIEKVWERYQELSLAERSKIGGIDISSDVLRSTAENITKMQDIKILIQKELEENKIHKISRIVEIILAGAIAIGASDIHIEPEKERGRLRLRLDGVLQDVDYFSTSIYRLLNSRIKLLSGMKLVDNKAQDGRFSIMEGKEELSIRTSLIPGSYGEAIVMRILDPRSIRNEIEDLGIESYLFSIIERELKKPNGLILVTGPTGSGKTTSLYAFLRRKYSTEINIITIEDPVEYRLEGITQTQANSEDEYGFLEGLRAALRQDPDVIMVGEIRDKETARIAIQSSLTGHLVFSTLHTNNAAGVIPRLIDLDVNPKILVSALSLSIAQRLVRRLCQNCRQTKEPTEKDTTLLQSIIKGMEEEGKDLAKYNIDKNKPVVLYTPVGCDKCNMTGYKGRIGIFEAIITDEEIENIIFQSPSEREIKRIAKKQGVLSMRQDGLVKILNGITSIEEVQAVVDMYEE